MYYFPDYYVDLYKNMWVKKAKTTETFVGIDEMNEFVNKFIKSHLYSMSVKRMLFLSENYNFLHYVNKCFGNIFNFRKQKKQKSKTLNPENLKIIVDYEKKNPKLFSIPFSLLKRFHNDVDTSVLQQELETLKEEILHKVGVQNEEE